MGNLKTIVRVVPALGMENLKHMLGPGDRANSHRREAPSFYSFCLGSYIKIACLLYGAVVFGLFDSMNATKNQQFYIMGYLARL